MMTKDYAMAYTEVLEILKHVPEEDVSKIPTQKIEFYKSNCDQNYDYKLDSSKEFKNQKMSKITKAILANIYRDYWAPLDEKEQIILREKRDIEELERYKKSETTPNEIFPYKNKYQEKTEEINYPVKMEKESFFKKIFNFLFGK